MYRILNEKMVGSWNYYNLFSYAAFTHAATALILMESEIFSISDTCAAAVSFQSLWGCLLC